MSSSIVRIMKIQSYPMGLPNRGSDGKPRVAHIGASRRYVASPQSVKRAMRLAFRDKLTETERAKRGRMFRTVFNGLSEAVGDSILSDDIDIVTSTTCIALYGSPLAGQLIPTGAIDKTVELIADPDTFNMVLSVGRENKIKPSRQTLLDPEDFDGGEVQEEEGKVTKLKNIKKVADESTWNRFLADLIEIHNTDTNTDVGFCGRLVTSHKGLSVTSAVSIGYAIDIAGKDEPISLNTFTAIDEFDTTNPAKPKIFHIQTDDKAKKVVSPTLYSEMTIDINQAAANLPHMGRDDIIDRVMWCVEAFTESHLTAGSTTAGPPAFPSTVLAYVADPTQGRLAGGAFHAFDRLCWGTSSITDQANARLIEYLESERTMWQTTGDYDMVTTGTQYDPDTAWFGIHETVNDLYQSIRAKL